MGWWKTRPVNIILHCLSFFKLMIDKAVLFIISFIPSLLRCVFHSRSSQDRSPSLREESNGSFSPRLDHREDIKQSCSCPKHTYLSYQRTFIRFMTSFYLAFGGFSLTLNAPPHHEALQKDNQVKMVVCWRNNKRSFNTSVTSTLPWATETQTRNSEDKSLKE